MEITNSTKQVKSRLDTPKKKIGELEDRRKTIQKAAQTKETEKTKGIKKDIRRSNISNQHFLKTLF